VNPPVEGKASGGSKTGDVSYLLLSIGFLDLHNYFRPVLLCCKLRYPFVGVKTNKKQL
jgi:hypothetical protein